MNPLVSVIIPTFKRAPFLRFALEALKKQTFKDFEIVVVVKPGGDETEQVLKEYGLEIALQVVIQHEGFVSKAYNLGIERAKGEIIAFLDDDSIPEPNWLQRYVDVFLENSKIGGVSGAAISAEMADDSGFREIPETTQLHMRWHEYYQSRWSYNRPITGMEDWWIFLGKDGLVHQRHTIPSKDIQKAIPSLLLMGANMSVRSEAIKGIKIDENLVLGFTYEQLLAYQIWSRGYKLFYDPRIKVFHIVHEESLGRFFQTPSRAAHREAEYILSFFLLRSEEREISLVPYVLELTSLIVSRALSIRNYGFAIASSRIYGLLYGLVAGCAYSISKVLRGKFSLESSLNKFMKTQAL